MLNFNASRSSAVFTLAVLCALLANLLIPALPAATGTGAWQEKIDPWVLETAASGETEFLVYLVEQADLSGAVDLTTRQEKGSFVYHSLVEVASRSQKPILAVLEQMGVWHRSFWVINMIWVRGGMDTIQAMAARADVAHLYANPSVHLDDPVKQSDSLACPDPVQPEWNITLVGAPDVWALGFTGQEAVVGGADTGYDWDHPALVNQYRGWDGATDDHNYNWFDATAAASTVPVDPYGHGTHTMGIMVGDDGAGIKIGMAPGARWIGCRNMDAAGNGSPATYATCYQWFIAPTDLQGNGADPAKAPHVINNSWGCPPSEGCTDPDVLLSVVDSVRAAGILTVHSAGNSGSSCETVNTPAAIYDSSFTVGATGSADVLASFSSRGPVSVDGSSRAKPDISAPGVDVCSSLPGTGYGSMDGTSMAAPHVAGLAALLISAQPALAGQVDQLETLIELSAVPKPADGCSSSGVPNNLYGWGRIDALQAVLDLAHTLEIAKRASSDEVAPGQILTYTLVVTNQHPYSPTHHVVLTDVLPVGTLLITATQPVTQSGDLLAWEVPVLEAGVGFSVSLVVQVPLTTTAGVVVNSQYGTDSDETLPVNGAPLETAILPYSLLLSKTVPPLVTPGDLLTYTLVVTNPHPLALMHGVVLSDALPLGTSFIAATGSYTLVDGVVRWELEGLAPGEAWTVQLVVRVLEDFRGQVENASYAVWSDEVLAPVYGQPVYTIVRWVTYLPLVLLVSLVNP